MNRVIPILVLIFLATATVAAGDGPSATPKPPASVPQWVFYWVLGLVSFFGSVGLLVIKLLWDWGKDGHAQAGALTPEEKVSLAEIHAVLSLKDANQTPLVYVPRQLVKELADLAEEAEKIRVQMQRLADQHDMTVTHLRSEVNALRASHDHLQERMLRLAVRVQRAVEALAGLEAPEIEDEFNANEED